MWPLLFGPSGKVISRSADASIFLASSVFTKAIVLAMRALSSAIVFSLSSYLGGSRPASRAPPFLAWSQALCTWRVNANMSGKRRALSNTVGSIVFASAYASALSRIAESALRPISNTGIDALDIDMAGSSLRWLGGSEHHSLLASMAAAEPGIAGERKAIERQLSKRARAIAKRQAPDRDGASEGAY